MHLEELFENVNEVHHIATDEDLEIRLESLNIPDDFHTYVIVDTNVIFDGEWLDVVSYLIDNYETLSGRIELSDSAGTVLDSFTIIH